jgi:type I restriction enzyme R subunit
MSLRIRRRRLPHIDVDGGTYFVTSCLAGSIPAEGLLDIKQYERELASRRPANDASKERHIRNWKLVFARTDSWLDRQPAVRHLADPQLSGEVEKSMCHFAGTRYDLLAYVVMPSHFHWVFRPLETWTATLPSDDDAPSPREIIMHSLKRFTARACNELLGTQGAFWQDESYDHSVRDEDELLRIIEYVEMNPVNAGLVEQAALWHFSSAYRRKVAWAEPGAPLLTQVSNA